MSGTRRAMCRTLRLPEEGRLLAEVKKPGTAECAEKHAEFAEVLSRCRRWGIWLCGIHKCRDTIYEGGPCSAAI
jgi:hypothetical protein